MYYKVLKNGKVIDVLDRLRFLRYQAKFDRMILSDIGRAQAIYSSDGETIWHEASLLPMPDGRYETVEAIPIDEREYHQLKALHGNTPEEIIDAYTLSLIEEGVL